VYYCTRPARINHGDLLWHRFYFNGRRRVANKFQILTYVLPNPSFHFRISATETTTQNARAINNNIILRDLKVFLSGVKQLHNNNNNIL